MQLLIVVISLLAMLLQTFGRLAAFLLCLFWAYNHAQRGDSFGLVIGVFIINNLISQLGISLIYWILTKFLMGLMVSQDE